MAVPQQIQPAYREGVDRKQLKQIRDRFLALNQTRIARTVEGLPTRHRDTLGLIPLFFHVNHPLLPGYASANAPYGVANYAPEKDILTIAQRFSRTFRFKSEKRRKPDILSLFLMGSTGTIAHSEKSDLDFWLCYRPDLNREALALLRQKADAVSAWAEENGLEVHFFLMNADRFRKGLPQSAVDKESSGTAQHFLLLDEFYRTSILVAGCYPLWWLIPAYEEPHYQELADLLLSKRFVKAEEVVDFGGIAHIPAEEFVGAGMWQLYKGIDTPYKSLLKLMLTEYYARTLGAGGRPLSVDYKASVYEGLLEANTLDPYVMVYRCLEKHLLARGENDRLELMRRSFYLKVGKKLTAGPSARGVSWQRQVLSDMVQQWQWPDPVLKRLDNRARWDVNLVHKERKVVVAELTHGYRFLSQLARECGLQASISKADMNLLGRKLYAAFQRQAGKIERINPGIAPSLQEENLAFYHETAIVDRVTQGDSWYLFRDIASPADVAFQSPIKRALSLVELIVWCYVNGLLARNTRLSLVSGATGVTMRELRGLVSALESVFPSPLPSASHDAFKQKAHLRQSLLVVNLGADPFAELSAKGMHKTSERHDSLGFSSLRDNLVLSLDRVDLNSWNEVSVHNYSLGDTLIQCLQHYLCKITDSQSADLPTLSVSCFCTNRGHAIGRRVEELFQQVAAAMFHRGAPTNTRYVIEMDRRYFVLQYREKHQFMGFDSEASLLAHLAASQPSFSRICFDSYALPEHRVLRVVCNAAKPDTIQVFFYVRKGASPKEPDWADVYLLDESGALLVWTVPFHNEHTLLVPMQRFLAAVTERRQMCRGMDIDVFELKTEFQQVWHDPRDQSLKLKRHYLPIDSAAYFVEIQAIAYVNEEDGLVFDIFCQQQEFSTLEYGSQLFHAVAHFIRANRKSGEKYPCYITDLGLAQEESVDSPASTTTIEYVKHKLVLEEGLNQALQAL